MIHPPVKKEPTEHGFTRCDEEKKRVKRSDLWSSRPPSSWPRRCRSPSRCRRCRGWSTARDKCSSGSRSRCPPSPGYSGTRRGDRRRDRSTSGLSSRLRTHTHTHKKKKSEDVHFSASGQGVRRKLFTPGHFHSAAWKCFLARRRLMCVSGAVLGVKWCAGSHFPPDVLLLPPRYIIGCFQYTDGMITLLYRREEQWHN